MSLFGKIKESLTGAKSSEIISRLTVVFAFLYHMGALICFYRLQIYPMFYFNCISVPLFLVVGVLVFLKAFKDLIVPYFICYIEVLLHQVFADYYLGIATSFHFFILMMGLLGFLILKNKQVISIIMGIISSALFVYIECMEPYFIPVYEIEEKYVLLMRDVNISLCILVLLLMIMVFATKALNSEHRLELQVSKKSQEVLFQNTKISRLQNHIIISLASLVENRDTDTGEHIQRTSAYVEIIARKAFERHIYPDYISEKFISLIKRAAPMHDVGKIVVPDEILKKPGRLTPEEFDKMKLHTTEGSRIIKEIVGISEEKDYVQTAIDVAESHHERWDGKGYPNNLKGQEIPVSARIMAIADVFDALVSPRCYKEPIPVEEAVQILREESGSHFDPILVEIFLSEREQVDEVLRTYKK